MPEKTNVRITRAEMQIMRHFWEAGESSIREIQERLSPAADLAYTTVQTLVSRLEEKGALARTRKIGNAFMFKPLITQQSISRPLLLEFLELFGGAEPLVAHLFESGQLTLDDLGRLEKAARKSKPSRRTRKRS